MILNAESVDDNDDDDDDDVSGRILYPCIDGEGSGRSSGHGLEPLQYSYSYVYCYDPDDQRIRDEDLADRQDAHPKERGRREGAGKGSQANQDAADRALAPPHSQK